MSYEFTVGQKVVCVDARESNPAHTLQKGKTYIIRKIGSYDWDVPILELGLTAVWIEGVLRVNERTGKDVPFGIHRFRPLKEESKSIQLFRSIAAGVSSGKPIIEDTEYRPEENPSFEEEEILRQIEAMFNLGRPIL